MSDIAFFGDRRTSVSDQGKILNNQNLETTVRTGGHKAVTTSTYHKCNNYISPGLTQFLIKKAKAYEKNPTAGNLIPYAGSNIQKSRSKIEHDTFNH